MKSEKGETTPSAKAMASKTNQRNKSYIQIPPNAREFSRGKDTAIFDCTKIEYNPGDITLVDMTSDKPIKSIGDWGVYPHHATRRKPIILRTPKKCSSSLRKFVKDLCACWHDIHGCFNTEGACLVLRGYPCSYFRRCVLPPENYKYGPPNLQELREAYSIIDVKAQNFQQKAVRRCPGINSKECGAPLPPRRRYCDKCRDRKRRNDDNERRRKY